MTIRTWALGPGRKLLDELTHVQTRMFLLLSDGWAHSRKELIACLDDDLTNPNTYKVHITTMRPILRKYALDIYSLSKIGTGKIGNGQYILRRIVSKDTG